MNKILRVSLIIIVVLLGLAALVWKGFILGRSMAWGVNGFFPGDMMGGFGRVSNAAPLSVEETRTAVESYLDSFNNEDLAIEEIMIFDNNSYAIVVEESTGIGAFELLVDPITKTVYPEFGPNMMWNLKYGMMSGFDGHGMMGDFFNNDFTPNEVTADLSVTSKEAFEVAQKFLDQTYPGVELSDEITEFYGYYTIDTERDGEILGMLSVNGFSGQVFPHTWHGDFIEMSEGKSESAQ